MTTSLPTLVIVSGLPASGKTTLARTLAEHLGWPLFDKDSLKELLGDAAEASDWPLDRALSRLLGRQAMELLYAVAGQLGRSGISTIIEAYFWPELAAPALAPLGQWSNLVQVHCSVADEVAIARYQARFIRGERHAVHLDGQRLGELNPAHRVAIPLEVPLIEVHTKDGYQPGIEEIVARIRAAGHA